MGLAKKGSRRIEVGGRPYRWVVSPDDEPGLGIVVEAYDQPGQRMLTWVDHGNTISPWLVRQAIQLALEQGWQPGQKGKPLSFRIEGILTPPEARQQGSDTGSGPRRQQPQSGQPLRSD